MVDVFRTVAEVGVTDCYYIGCGSDETVAFGEDDEFFSRDIVLSSLEYEIIGRMRPWEEVTPF